MTKYKELVKQMTLDEKIDMLSGIDFMWTKGLERLRIPRVRMADASMGLRQYEIPATAFPATICLAATWNRQLAADYGDAVSKEFRAENIHVLLGPGVNMYRLGQCSRNFEYMGEDPFLAAEMVVPYIKAVQALGVAATIKHFACNNSDWWRKDSNSIVDERTMREIYFPAFEAAIQKADSKALMTAYNRLNGDWCGESNWLIQSVLRQDWGFEGLVMSDWNALVNTDKVIEAGLNLEMPSNKFVNQEKVKALLFDKKVTEEQIDYMVEGLVKFSCEVIEEYEKTECPVINYNDQAAVALEVAREGIVLLKNDDEMLPLEEPTRIVMLGPDIRRTPIAGGGAAKVDAVDPISLPGAMRNLYPSCRITFKEADMKDADAVILCLGFKPETEHEGMDRKFELEQEQLDLIKKATAASNNVIVVLTCGGGVEMSGWCDDVSAIIHQWYPGQNGCQATGEIIAGQVNPSGKLPISIEKKFSDNPASKNYIPEGKEWYATPVWIHTEEARHDMKYEEGVFTGYRHYDTNKVEPQFPFGFGLSYTTFDYSDLKVTNNNDGTVKVSFIVTNTGNEPGAEITQVYVAPPGKAIERPEKELKGFEKVNLANGEHTKVKIILDERAFQYYDVKAGCWASEADAYTIMVGSSSRDIKLQETITL